MHEISMNFFAGCAYDEGLGGRILFGFINYFMFYDRL